MAQQNIQPGKAPILWSTVDEAFAKINSNFTELYLSIGGNGADLTNIPSSLIPDTDITRDLGSPSKRWRDLYLSGDSLYVGVAKITADSDGKINLPAGSTVGGQLISNPDLSAFKTISISGQANISSSISDSINFVGSGLSISTNPQTNTITFSSPAIQQIISGGGVTVTTSPGTATISNTGVLEITAGNGITVSRTQGNVTISNDFFFEPQNVFNNIAVFGSETLTASLSESSITLVGDDNIKLTSQQQTKTINFNFDNQIDIIGSVFADDSTLLVDGINGIIPAENILGTFQGLEINGNLVINGNTDFIQAELQTLSTQITIVDQQITNTNSSIESLEASLFDPPYGGNPNPGPNPTILSQISSLQSQRSFLESQRNSFLSQQNNYNNLLETASIELSYDVMSRSFLFDRDITAVNFMGNLTGDVTGSLFGNDSTILVDSIDSSINLNRTVKGNIVPNSSSEYDLGSSDFKFKDIYLSGNLYIDGESISGQGGIGYTGSKGDIGFTGSQGIQGPQGAQGVQGTTGTQGFTGIQGAIGFQGIQGVQGPQGVQGVQGVQGLKGTIGDIGFTGSRGDIGFTGSQGAMSSRTAVSNTSSEISNNSSVDMTITGFKGYLVYKIATSHASWVRLYSSQTARTADTGRSETEEPLSGSGVLAEVITTGNETVSMTPGVVGFNDESPPTNDIFLRITNKSGGSAEITVSLTIVKTED